MKPPDVKAQREKQATKIQRAYDYLKTCEGGWVSALELARAIQSMAVSTKISQARELATAADEEILWNGDPNASAYMLRPRRLGRDAAEQIKAPWDQGRPYMEPFRLIPPE